MSKTVTQIRSLARSHTRSAINTLAQIMRNKDATPAARVAAANALLDRGWGKPVQAIANGEEGALQLIHRIERVIVDPENSDGSDLGPLLVPAQSSRRMIENEIAGLGRVE